MKILAINGSYRKNGNTKILLEEVLKECKRASIQFSMETIDTSTSKPHRGEVGTGAECKIIELVNLESRIYSVGCEL